MFVFAVTYLYLGLFMVELFGRVGYGLHWLGCRYVVLRGFLSFWLRLPFILCWWCCFWGGVLRIRGIGSVALLGLVEAGWWCLFFWVGWDSDFGGLFVGFGFVIRWLIC